MSELQEGGVQPAEAGQRSCIFSVLSLFPVPCAILLWICVFLGASGYGALAMGSVIAPLSLASLLLSAAGSAVALWRREPCTRLAKGVFFSSLLLSMLVLTSLVRPSHDEPPAPAVPAAMFGTQIVPMDHERGDTFVRSVRVKDRDLGPAPRGRPARPDHRFESIYLPYSWRPGLTVVVEWERCNHLPFGKTDAEPLCRRIEKTVVVEKYDYEVNHAWLHILPDDQARIILDLRAPGEPGYPGPVPIEPGPNDLFQSPIRTLDHDPFGLEGVHINGQRIDADTKGLLLPYEWRPGLTVLVKWQRCTHTEPRSCRSIERRVDFPKYEAPDTPTWVHMMPGDQVLLINSARTPADPDYPGPSWEDEEAAYRRARERRRSLERHE
ncbi:DUF3304 domain-containing protein [Lysobacter arvi]|uniref:DUF3304 domain-containing protein n=1 Tax=Lysobacter arvi TaxID=3038776 RepID=A0ABU1CDB1_9GAMM|nr:DUF3304 domain-containing protein [Lysobacter arvi]MDR0183168.1 DUF3304 domain-containing protein [Lysobacter arvi]